MKIVISIFCLPYEIDELERMLIQLKRSSYYLSGDNEWLLDVSIGLSDYLVDWNESKLPKSYFIDKLHYLQSMCDWCDPSFHHDDHIKGCVSQRRNSMKLVEDADYFIWLDTDIIFEERTLSYVENTINSIGSYPMSIITPEIVRIWDNTWDCLVNDEFIDESLKEVSNQINSDCPIVLDKTTTLVSSQYYNSTFKYIYVFDWEAYGTENLTDLQEKLRPGVVNYYCTNPNMSLFRELEVAVYYTYLDKNKNHLFEISVMPGECKSNEG